jgi:hypothetical protein
MKTTIELSDELYRRAKVHAAQRGQTMKELVEDGLRLAMKRPRNAGGGPSLTKLMKDTCGIVDSGLSDLATNPKHLRGFGRDASRRR